MGRVDGRVAVVTGASRGIGRAIAVRLAAEGAVVVAAARGDHAGPVAEEIRASGGRADAVALDVTDAASIERLVSSTLASHSRIDILVNNAGIARDNLALRLKRDDWDAVIATNLSASFACAQAVLKPMIRQRSGRIISISSVVGQAGNAGQVNYAASKAGLIGMTKALALEVASRNVTVNAVAPGLIETDMIRALAEDTQRAWADKIPAGRLGTPEDVANAVVFLASDEAAYITGQVLAVNGGMYL